MTAGQVKAARRKLILKYGKNGPAKRGESSKPTTGKQGKK